MLRLFFLLSLLLSGGFQAARAQVLPCLKPIMPLLLMPVPALAQLPSTLAGAGLFSGFRCLSVPEHPQQQAIDNEKGTAIERQQVRYLLTK